MKKEGEYVQLIRKIGMILLGIFIIASSNLIFNDNADYQKASAASGVWEFVDFKYAQNIDTVNYNYAVSGSYSVHYSGYDSTGKRVWYSGDTKWSIVPGNLGIVKISYDGSGGFSKYSIQRQKKDTSIGYNPTQIREFVAYEYAQNIDTSKFNYQIHLQDSGNVYFYGQDVTGRTVWSTVVEYPSTLVSVPNDKGIVNLNYSGAGGFPNYLITRIANNTAPIINLSLTPYNHVLSKKIA